MHPDSVLFQSSPRRGRIAPGLEFIGWEGRLIEVSVGHQVREAAPQPVSLPSLLTGGERRQEPAGDRRPRGLSLVPARRPASPWSRSRRKRAFDVVSVVLALPLVLPLILVAALAVRLTSRGPAFFLQKRIGRAGRPFTIVKFRTMACGRVQNAVTTSRNQPFTPIGRFLRTSKIDELPQLLNILIGDMSLVGARPKLTEHQVEDLQCRPGITGAATIAFADEEEMLAGIPGDLLDTYYREVVLPAKAELDRGYMAQATFSSDMQLIFRSIFRRWDAPELTVPQLRRMPESLRLFLSPVKVRMNGSDSATEPASD
ncbi:MAG: sugar transferase [Terracidiphilus sp.]